MIPGIYCIEHKTTSSDITPGSKYWKRLRLDGQASNYNDAVKQLYGEEARGIIYDVIRKPTIWPLKATAVESRKFKKDGALYANQRDKDESPDEYSERLLADIAEKPEKYYQRGEVVRLESDVKAHAGDIWAIGEQIRNAQKTQRWPRNTDACDYYSGCAYWPVCAGESEITDPSFCKAEKQHPELSEGNCLHLPVLTSSSIKSYRSCPRKYYYAYELRRRPVKSSDSLRFGTLFHQALEIWWKTADLEQALTALSGEADPYERVEAACLMVGYHTRWVDEPYEVLGVEKEFSLPVVNPDTGKSSRTWILGGKFDAIARKEAAVA